MDESQNLAVRDIGQGILVLVVHGWEMSGVAEAHDFEPIFTKTSGYRRIYVDLPGMGASPAGQVKDLDSIVQVLSAFVEEHILPSNFLLIGSSLGAYLARALAYRYSSAVSGLLLRVPVTEPDTPKRDVDPFLPAMSDPTFLSTLSKPDRNNLGDIPVQIPAYIELHRHKASTVWSPAVALSDSAAIDPIRNDPKLYRVTAPMHTPETPFIKPTLVVTGRQDVVVGYRDAWALTTCYPRATFVALDRGGHGLPIDETELFAALVKDWLRRVEETQRV